MATVARFPQQQTESVTAALAQALRASADAMAAALIAMRAATDAVERLEDEPAAQQGDAALTPKQVATDLGVSRATVHALIKSGRIRVEEHATGLYRVRRSELDAYKRRVTRSLRKREL